LQWYRYTPIPLTLIIALMAWQLWQAHSVQSDTLRAMARMTAQDLRDIPAYLDGTLSATADRGAELLETTMVHTRHAEASLRVIGQHLDRSGADTWRTAATGLQSATRAINTTQQRLGYFGELPSAMPTS
jgi:hypothetical protein